MPLSPADTATQIESWFDEHGLPYFTGDHADRVEAWLSSKRISAVIVLIIAMAVAAGIAVGTLVADDGSWGTIAGIVTFLLLLGLFAGRLLRMGTMLR